MELFNSLNGYKDKEGANLAVIKEALQNMLILLTLYSSHM